MSVNDPIAVFLGEWSHELNVGSILFRILLSVFIAAIIGCERSSKRHAAGLRTFILVSLASTAAGITDEFLVTRFHLTFSAVSAAAVIGAAIISSNSILYSSKNQIKGLTTSVGLWACGIIGVATGAGLYTVTVASFIAMMLILSLFPVFESYLKNRSNHFEVHLELKNRSNLQDFVSTIRRLGLRIDDIESNPAYLNSGLSVYSVSITIASSELKKYKKHSEIIDAIQTLDYVYYIEEMS